MLVLRPRLHELVGAHDSRTLKQLEALGVDAPEANVAGRTTVALVLPGSATRAQQLLAQVLLDYILRLDPLVTEVQLSGFRERDVNDLRERIPLEIARPSGPPDYAVAVGRAADADLTVDASGWLAQFGGPINHDEGGITNPIGPLAGAAISAGEVFKALFQLNYPDAPYARRFVETSGLFSFFDYRVGASSPPLEAMAIDAFLIGLGGVGAGVVQALAKLGPHLTGLLRLIDADALSTDNLNRVTYARWQSALDRRSKVTEAQEYLEARLPNLTIDPHPQRFDVFKRQLARRRQDRHYETVVTGLDDDEVRHEVQRDLPRVLIDGATGRDANVRVERVVLGEWGCLGCTRQNGPVALDGRCDVLPDAHAPSVSFVSGFAGTLAAAELIKGAMANGAALRGSFDHVFVYGLNPDLRTQAAQVKDCRISCSEPSVTHAYHTKYEEAR